MNYLMKPNFLFCFLSFLLFIHSRSTIAQEVDDQREFDYVKGSGKGPEQWGSLRQEWAACNNGDLQSPIDLLSERVETILNSGDPKLHYKPSNATLRNRGHDITLQWTGDAGYVQVDGTNYTLRQSHWHSPSEHTINGKSFALELHMVHQNIDPVLGNRTVVVGVMYDLGKRESFLSEIEDHINHISDSENEWNVGILDPRHIKIRGKKYYRYSGSLTTPPCTQGVIWILNRRVRSVAVEQVKLLRDAVHDYAENNARPLQPLNHRDIFVYKTRQH